MTRKISRLFMLIFLLLTAEIVSASEIGPPQVGGVLPEIELLKPDNPVELKYLGLSGGGFFKINQIKADVAIIEYSVCIVHTVRAKLPILTIFLR